MITMVNGFLLALGLTVVLILVLVPVARASGLLDVPDRRKHHARPTPLVGGIAIFLCLLISGLWFDTLAGPSLWFMAAAGLLVAVGVADDFSHLPVAVRIVVEFAAATLMVFGAGVMVYTVGNLLGIGVAHFPVWAAYLFSAVAVFGIINALNMLDGLDGLCAGISLVSLAVLYGAGHGMTNSTHFGLILLPALLGFLVFNCGLVPGLPKVFLGDAGSKLIGFAMVWLLIEAAQPRYSANPMPPVTALYFVGLPLIDMVATTLGRVRHRMSPFEPDRTHLHHVFIDGFGMSRRATVVVMIGLALAINLLGVAQMRTGVPEVVQFVVFFALFFAVLGFKMRFRARAGEAV